LAGACLRHFYYEGYRFSEDIDFSCTPGGDNLDTSLQLLQKTAEWIQTEDFRSSEILSLALFAINFRAKENMNASVLFAYKKRAFTSAYEND